MDVDFSEINRLAADLGKVPANAGKFVSRVMGETATAIRDDAREAVKKRKHFKQAANTIGYRSKGFSGFGATVLDVEVGYDRSKPSGRLGNLIEYGAPGAKNALAPGGELQKALKAHEDEFVEKLGKIADIMDGPL